MKYILPIFILGLLANDYSRPEPGPIAEDTQTITTCRETRYPGDTAQALIAEPHGTPTEEMSTGQTGPDYP